MDKSGKIRATPRLTRRTPRAANARRGRRLAVVTVGAASLAVSMLVPSGLAHASSCLDDPLVFTTAPKPVIAGDTVTERAIDSNFQ